MSFVTVILVENTGLYSGGITALFQGIARISYAAMDKNHVNPELADIIYNLLFWGLYLLINIPLFFFA